jgi:hypothetical protein
LSKCGIAGPLTTAVDRANWQCSGETPGKRTVLSKSDIAGPLPAAMDRANWQYPGETRVGLIAPVANNGRIHATENFVSI